MTEFCSCRRHHEITDIAKLRACAVCNVKLHVDCAVACGMVGKCTTVWCHNHALRRPSCCYLEDDDKEALENDETMHLNGVPLCEEHVKTCSFCRFAICAEHEEVLSVTIGPRELIVECRNCSKSCCYSHWVECSYCDPECVTCAGLDSDDEGDRWREIYEYDYLCKHHRYMQHVEACVTPPDSPEGEPMTKKTRKRMRK